MRYLRGALVLLGDGAGHLGPKANVDINGAGGSQFPFSIVVGDFNEDSTPDIATSNANSDNHSVVPATATARSPRR